MDPTTEKVAEQAASALGISQLVPAIYQDILQPAARETGQNLLTAAKAVSLALSPLKGTVWGLEQVRDYLSATVAAKLARKPAGEIKRPDPIIAGPVIMGMVFASEAPHLREMYANLLAKAMHGSTAERAHPSFARVIEQLSPQEAKILKSLANTPFSLLVTTAVNPDGGVDVCESILQQWREFCEKNDITNPVLADAYYSNFIRLGILSERYQIVSNPFISATGLEAPVLIRVTDYGELFLDVCVRDF